MNTCTCICSDSSSFIISFSASFISIATLLAYIYFFIENKRMTQYQINIQKISESEKFLKEKPDLLKFHNIDISEVIKEGVTEEEFFYILSSLRASEAFYTIKNKNKKFSKYREVFLNNPKVELVYVKFLRQKFFCHTTFGKYLDNFYGI